MQSRISQMLNGTQMPQQQPQLNQQQLNNSIAQVQKMMQMVRMSQNPQAELAKIIQNNPNSSYIAQMLRGGNSLESMARSMAQQQGVDINALIKQLSQGQQ